MSVRVARAAWARGWGAGWHRGATSVAGPPSGAVDVAELLRDATAAEEPRAAAARREPGRCSVLLFPGQGSQLVGMGRGLLGFPRVRELYDAASRVLGYDLLALSLHGPQEDLDRTVHCQPAIFVASLAAVEKLHHLQPEVIENCVAAAGFSVGEFAALVFAGAMDFSEDACGKKGWARLRPGAGTSVRLPWVGTQGPRHLTCTCDPRVRASGAAVGTELGLGPSHSSEQCPKEGIYLFIYFIYLKELQREREGGRSVGRSVCLPSSGSLPRCPSGQS
ncbi:malonyl-CoA-acyl carrier protein transacylase, mitochondrial isoform X2 [Oryctolagus cuniculus]|uniref:malonyl-CoA-acyl carrier protein transacylase, mitochondrial isoform X2 n=1 Tax=Oryctolagus cuniculus TaxID=9986 RepID=UPI0038794B66